MDYLIHSPFDCSDEDVSYTVDQKLGTMAVEQRVAAVTGANKGIGLAIGARSTPV